MDIHALAKDPSPGVRASLAGKISHALARDEFAQKEKEIAADILRILARDIEMQVRRSVALALSESISAPHDLVWRLANDVAEVAVPVLSHSPVLSEEDLIEIVHSTEEVAKLVGIAGRESISEMLSEAILATSNEAAATALLKNKSANISDESIDKHLEFLSDSTTLLENSRCLWRLAGKSGRKVICRGIR